jgi:NtrC-family two-component system response regulator AlgB
MNGSFSVLIVDDERTIADLLSRYCQSRGAATTTVNSFEAGLRKAHERSFDLAFVDLRLDDESGLQLIPELIRAQPGMAVVLMSAFASLGEAAEAMRRGAQDVIAKPFDPLLIDQQLQRVKIRREALAAPAGGRLSQDAPETILETQNPAMAACLALAQKAAGMDAPVLLTGETGTGKGLMARLLHDLSPRAAEPFVVVNCPALTAELAASELFGHVKGSFTGAVGDREGYVHAAGRGTLFLDEIGDLAPAVQSRLLRLLNDREFERVGESKARRCEARVIAATNLDLGAAIRSGAFRSDLLYRLNTLALHLPSLRERPEDLLKLARGLMRFFAERSGKPGLRLSRGAESSILACPWPGNLRQLRNAMERAAHLADGEEAGAADLGIPAQEAGPAEAGLQSLEAVEMAHIAKVLKSASSNEEAAKILGIDPSTLWRKRKKFSEKEGA